MQSIHKQTYGDQITEYIKSRILKGEFGPGDKINEVDIATRLKVSRAPVREALQHLAQTGSSLPSRKKGNLSPRLPPRKSGTVTSRAAFSKALPSQPPCISLPRETSPPWKNCFMTCISSRKATRPWRRSPPWTMRSTNVFFPGVTTSSYGFFPAAPAGEYPNSFSTGNGAKRFRPMKCTCATKPFLTP